MLLFNFGYQLTLKFQREISEDSSTIFITDECFTIFKQKDRAFFLLKCFISYLLIVLIARNSYNQLWTLPIPLQNVPLQWWSCSSKVKPVCLYTVSSNKISWPWQSYLYAHITVKALIICCRCKLRVVGCNALCAYQQIFIDLIFTL